MSTFFAHIPQVIAPGDLEGVVALSSVTQLGDVEGHQSTTKQMTLQHAAKVSQDAEAGGIF